MPPEITSALLTLLIQAQMRGWIDVRSLAPILRLAVEKGYAPQLRSMLGQIDQMIEDIEVDVRPSK